jgi:AbrB family looped-hinge helix DNA binding protein
MQANMTVKGQVTIPKAMRDHLGLAPGATVRFAYTEDGGVVILPATAQRTSVKSKPSRFDKLKGSNRAGWAASGLKSTDEIMGLLRGYDEDARDPGFAPAASGANRKHSK